jgi:hypothetical protein
LIQIFETGDFVEIVNTGKLNGFRGTIESISSTNVCKIKINGNIDHTDFYIFATMNEMKFINNHTKGRCV